jgi:DNA modification methylase
MQHILIKSIIIPPDRQRREFDPVKMQELGNSIADQGLFHAVVLRPSLDGPTLVAGERRLRAMDELHTLGRTFKHNNEVVPLNHAPVVTLGELNAYQVAEAELEENIRRDDLTWQERAAANKKLHELRQAQALDEGRVHTLVDTALEIRGGSSPRDQDNIRKDLVVAKYLDDADVVGAKTAQEAYKIIKKKEQTALHAELGAEVGKTFGAHSHVLLQGNCISFLNDWFIDPVGPRFDVILTDPPYGMGADEFGDAAGKLSGTTHNYSDDEASFRWLMQQFLPYSFFLTKPQAHMYLCCDIDQFHWLRDEAIKAGWQVFRTPLINHKLNSGRVPWPETGPRRTWEAILYAVKGNRPVNFIAPDLLQTAGDPQLGHGAQKPIALFYDLLKRSVRPGDSVLDPFAGTGTIFPAAHGLKCFATGIEQDTASYGICVERLRGLE